MFCLSLKFYVTHFIFTVLRTRNTFCFSNCCYLLVYENQANLHCSWDIYFAKKTYWFQNKCARYWPEPNSAKDYGKLKVKNLDESSTAHYTLREFVATKEGCAEERKVFHYHFQVSTNQTPTSKRSKAKLLLIHDCLKAWPDHGVPADPGCVLNFLHEVNKRQESLMLDTPGAILVHCSAGIGRTGTFIVIDMILDQLKKFGTYFLSSILNDLKTKCFFCWQDLIARSTSKERSRW